MARHTTIDKMREFEFAKSAWWEVAFPGYVHWDGNGKVEKFFPAQSVTEVLGPFVNGELDFGGTVIKYPNKVEADTISLQLVEISDYSLIKWIKNWYSIIYSLGVEGGTGVGEPAFNIGLLGDLGKDRVVREIKIMRYDGRFGDKPVDTSHYLVIPEGEVSIEHDSSKDGLITLSLTLAIVGQ